MTLRILGSIFIFLYGLLLPVLAFDFVDKYFWASVAMILCCIVISILLLFKVCSFFNIFISFIVFKIYLIRPYVDVYIEELSEAQVIYIEGNNQFFNASDATIVYFGILSLLIAWLTGLTISLLRHPPALAPKLPRVFLQLDSSIANADWRFCLVWLLLVYLNYTSGVENWQGIASRGAETTTLFAYGLADPSVIGIVCLCAFVKWRASGNNRGSWLLIVPVLYELVVGTLSGSRGAAFNIVLYATLYWVFLNYDKRIYIRMKSFWIAAAASLGIPLVLFFGLVAQSIKPLLRTVGMENSQVYEAVFQSIDVFDPDNVIFSNLYFGVTEILHRLSALDAQFLILNDHFVNSPWDNYNPLNSFLRMVNDLLPGTLFPGLLSINQVFHAIYMDYIVHYSSTMWGIQGTLYLYFGYWMSPVIVILLALFVSRRWISINYALNKSPTYLVFMMLLALTILENGTLERVVPVHIIRPLASFFVMTFLISLLYTLFPNKKKF